VAAAVLRHRIIPNYNATGEGISVEDIIRHLLAKL
jgi:MoxR-like ATPase